MKTGFLMSYGKLFQVMSQPLMLTYQAFAVLVGISASWVSYLEHEPKKAPDPLGMTLIDNSTNMK